MERKNGPAGSKVIMSNFFIMAARRYRLAVIAICCIAMFSGCSRGSHQGDYEIAESMSGEIICPPHSTKEYRPWGKSGVWLGCWVKHGHFVAVEGHLRIRGQYDNGREVGRWKFYDQEGNVYKEVDYSGAEESGSSIKDEGE